MSARRDTRMEIYRDVPTNWWESFSRAWLWRCGFRPAGRAHEREADRLARVARRIIRRRDSRCPLRRWQAGAGADRARLSLTGVDWSQDSSVMPDRATRWRRSSGNGETCAILPWRAQFDGAFCAGEQLRLPGRCRKRGVPAVGEGVAQAGDTSFSTRRWCSRMPANHLQP